MVDVRDAGVGAGIKVGVGDGVDVETERRARRARAGSRARARRLGFSGPAYLVQARHALAEAVAPDPGTTAALRYVSAHLAALRCAAAVLAVRGRPNRRRPGTAWAELAEVAPELGGWAVHFATGAELREAAETGLRFPLGHADVDALCRDVDRFLREVEQALVHGEQAVLPSAG